MARCWCSPGSGRRSSETRPTRSTGPAPRRSLAGEGHGCPLTDPEAVDRLARSVLRSHGGVDLLVNGTTEAPPAEGLDDFERAMQAGYYTPVRLALAFLPGMRARRSGHIVNLRSPVSRAERGPRPTGSARTPRCPRSRAAWRPRCCTRGWPSAPTSSPATATQMTRARRRRCATWSPSARGAQAVPSSHSAGGSHSRPSSRSPKPIQTWLSTRAAAARRSPRPGGRPTSAPATRRRRRRCAPGGDLATSSLGQRRVAHACANIAVSGRPRGAQRLDGGGGLLAVGGGLD